MGVSLSGTTVVTPIIQNKSVTVSGKTQITASPSTSTSGISKYYMAVETPEDLNAYMASPTVTSEGYGSSSHYSSSSDGGAAGANESGTYYIPVPSAVFSVGANYATLSSAGTSPTSVTSQYFKITPTFSGSTAGWVIDDDIDGTVQNYTVRSASTFTMTGSAVTDVVTVGTLSSGYYPISAKVKGTVSASTAGWFSSSGAVQAGTATQVGKIAAATFAAQGADINCTSSGYTGTGTVGSINEGSATTPTASGASTSTSLSGTTLTVARSVTPTVVAGYVSSGTAGTVTITGTVPTETKAASGSGTISPSSGKLLSSVTVGAGSATPGATVTGSSSALTSPTAMNNQYFTVTPTASVGTAGWISSISNGTQLKYKVKDGSATTPATSITANPSAITWDSTNSKFKTTTSATKSITPTVSAGWVSSGTAGTATVSGSTDVPTIEITATITGTTSATPVIQNKSVTVSGKTQITASPSTSTSGISTYYMAVETPEDMNSIMASPSVVSAGYSDGSHYTSSSDGIGAGAEASGTYYIPLATAAFTTSGASVLTTVSGAGWVPANTIVGTISNGAIAVNSPTITPSISSTYTSGSGYAITGSATTTASVSTAGYLTS